MRRFVRHPTDIPIGINVIESQAEEDSVCSMTTVSQGGLSCEVPNKVEVGAKVDIDVSAVSPAYHGCGQVIWCKEKGECFELGICFIDREEAFKARMVQQVCQIEQYKNMVFEKEGRVLDGNQAAAEWIKKYASEFV